MFLIPRTQSRTGKTGTCFRTCLASVLNLRESQVPDFKRANLDPEVNRWLGKNYGLQYKELPITDPAPLGYHFILGLSPRGGQHCVVGYNGRLAHDPHPMDGTGRGVKPEEWGVLVPMSKAQDIILSGKRLNTAAEPLLARHDAIKASPVRIGNSEACYRTTSAEIASLLADAERLLGHAKLDDDPSYWKAKLTAARKYLATANAEAKAGNYGRAVAYQEAAFSATHAVLSKLRKSGAHDTAEPYQPGDTIKLKNGKLTKVEHVVKGENLFNQPCWYVWTATGECVVIPAK